MLANHPLNLAENGAFLVGVDDKREFDLTCSDTFIGRAKENDISLVSDLSLSRRHAVITVVDGVYYLRDLRSSNGTLLNGKPVDGLVALSPDDEIFLGRTRLLFSPSADRLDSIKSYVSDEDTTYLGSAKPSIKTRMNNMMLVLKRLFPTRPTADQPLLPPSRNLRASHTSELLRSIQQ